MIWLVVALVVGFIILCVGLVFDDIENDGRTDYPW